MKTAVHSGTVTPVVSLPQERVIVYPSSPAAAMESLTFFNASSDFSSSSPSPATLTILKAPLPKTGCLFKSLLSASASRTPGTIQRE